MRPLAIDLFCGLGGWTEGLLKEGWWVIGFDIERHDYGTGGYPAQLVLQDVLTLHGSQFKDADLIVASPPCQAYSYRAMPWSRAKALPPPDNSLFEACFRIQREAIEVAGHFIPLVVENVRGAQKWVGRARWNFGSFYLWGDVPALMPMTRKAVKIATMGQGWYPPDHPKHVPGLGFNTHAARAIKNNGGSWFNVAHNTTSGKGQNPDGRKVQTKLHQKRDGHASTKHLTNPAHRATIGVQEAGQIGSMVARPRTAQAATPDRRPGSGPDWFDGGPAAHGSGSNARKAASAVIAKIPLVLSRHIARVFKP